MHITNGVVCKKQTSFSIVCGTEDRTDRTIMNIHAGATDLHKRFNKLDVLFGRLVEIILL